MRPDVSIIIPVYNAGALIDRCLDSVFNQIGNHNIEVLIIDDGSTDNSIDLVKRRPEKNNIKIFRQTNSGPSKARNKGISEAKGKYTAFIDADDYWLPEFLDETIKFLNSNDKCVAVSVAQKHITIDGCSESPNNWGNITNGKTYVIENFFNFWGEYNHICTGSILIRTSITKQIGGMREDLRSCEDLEFWAMVGTTGPIAFIPKILFVSDGNKVTHSLGWGKYRLRFKSTTNFGNWIKRLKNILTQKQIIDATPRFNSIVIGITRSFICAKKYNDAYKNLNYYYIKSSNNNHYIVTIASKGKVIWYTFCQLYYLYRYLKVSIPYYKHKFFHK